MFSGTLPESTEYETISGYSVRSILSGSIPRFNTAQEINLIVNNAAISGTVPQYFRDTHPHMLSLKSMRFLSGTIPHVPAEAAAASVLRFLTLSGTQLSGHLPPVLFSYNEMQYCHILRNRLSGSLPTIPKNHYLISFTISNNRISGNPRLLRSGSRLTLQFAGTLHNNMSFQLPLLNDLTVQGNRLSGTLLHDWFEEVKHFFAFDNMLSGILPEQISRGEEYLQSLMLSNNRLSSSLPASFQGLKRLVVVDLSNCSLSGDLAHWPVATELRYMHLQSNAFVGNLEQANLSFSPLLVSLMLSYNSISGTIAEDFLIDLNDHSKGPPQSPPSELIALMEALFPSPTAPPTLAPTGPTLVPTAVPTAAPSVISKSEDRYTLVKQNVECGRETCRVLY